MNVQTYLTDYQVPDPDPAAQLVLLQWLACHGHEVVDQLFVRPAWRDIELAAAQRAYATAYDKLVAALTLSDTGAYLQACADLGQPVPWISQNDPVMRTRIAGLKATNKKLVATYLAPWRTCQIPPREPVSAGEVEVTWAYPVIDSSEAASRIVGFVDMQLVFSDIKLAFDLPLDFITADTDPVDFAPFVDTGATHEVFFVVRSALPDPCAVLREMRFLQKYLPGNLWVVVSGDTRYRKVFEVQGIRFYAVPAV